LTEGSCLRILELTFGAFNRHCYPLVSQARSAKEYQGKD
jgi:hypothetical protein